MSTSQREPAKPVKQLHKCPYLVFVHVPPFKHDPVAHALLLISQLSPLKPWGQLHLKPATKSTHTPPFRHVSGLHSCCVKSNNRSISNAVFSIEPRIKHILINLLGLKTKNAYVDIVLAEGAGVAVLASTIEPIRSVQTLAAIHAGVVGAVVSLDITMSARVARRALTDIAINLEKKSNNSNNNNNNNNNNNINNNNNDNDNNSSWNALCKLQCVYNKHFTGIRSK